MHCASRTGSPPPTILGQRSAPRSTDLLTLVTSSASRTAPSSSPPPCMTAKHSPERLTFTTATLEVRQKGGGANDSSRCARLQDGPASAGERRVGGPAWDPDPSRRS